MTTSYHPEFDNPRNDSHRQSLSDCPADEDPHGNDSQHDDLLIAHDHDDASMSSTTRNPSSASSVANATPTNEASAQRHKSQSASSSPDPYVATDSALQAKFHFRRSGSSGALSSSVPSSIANSPARLTPTAARRKSYDMGKIEKIISITPTCYLKPKCFFVAWNSVITLVFSGWPEPIDTMKSELANSATVCKERYGSKWPKISLACVKDGVEMTPKKLHKIRRICEQSTIPKDWVLCVDSLSVALYENRSQESIIYEKIIPLKKNHKFLGSPKPLLLDMDDSDQSAFLRSANRTSHYRSLVIGSSIVHRLCHVPKFIIDFQAKLPQDIYDTFSKDSLHVTIRSLC